MEKPALVLRLSRRPCDAAFAVADGCARAGVDVIVVVDQREHAALELPGTHVLQAGGPSDLLYAGVATRGHPAIKNLGYLEALRVRRPWLAELAEPTFPNPAFFLPRKRQHHLPVVRRAGWINVCKYFSTEPLWLRGLPLEFIQEVPPAFRSLPVANSFCPIQQGLSEGQPDADALFRLVGAAPAQLHQDRMLALEEGTWSPINGRNTTWWAEALPLLYLPATCPGRLADIWRGLIAQRIGWANQWGVLVHGPTVREPPPSVDPIEHFAEEVPGYLHNRKITACLERVQILPGREHLAANLRRCYEAMIGLGVLAARERVLLEAWLLDLVEFGALPESGPAGAVA